MLWFMYWAISWAICRFTYWSICLFFSARAHSYFISHMIHKLCHLSNNWFVYLFLLKTEWIGRRGHRETFNWCWASPTTMSPFNKLTGAESVTSLQRPPTQSHSKLDPAMATRSDAFEALTLAQLRQKHGQATFANPFSRLCQKIQDHKKYNSRLKSLLFQSYMWCMIIGANR